MNREQKAAVVEEIAEQLQGAEAIFAVDYRGISVPDAAALRSRLREADAIFRVVKNRLTLRAAERAGTEPLRALLEGPTALTFVHGDAALAAKALNDFARAGDALEFKGGMLGDEPLTVEQIVSIARLPAREVLHGQLVGTIASPLTRLAGGLNALLAGIAIQLAQIQEQGLLGGAEEEAPAEPEAAAPDGGEDAAPSEGGDETDNEADASADENAAEA